MHADAEPNSGEPDPFAEVDELAEQRRMARIK
jgi:hypothetical protein